MTSKALSSVTKTFDAVLPGTLWYIHCSDLMNFQVGCVIIHASKPTPSPNQTTLQPYNLLSLLLVTGCDVINLNISEGAKIIHICLLCQFPSVLMRCAKALLIPL